MKQFFWKCQAAFKNFMIGRHGMDQLSMTLIYLVIILNLLMMFIPSLAGFSIIPFAIFIYSLFRVLSKNDQARYRENAWFLNTFGELPIKIKQWFKRMINIRKYLYFDCPKCHAKLRIPRGVGEVTIICGKCGERIQKKA